MKWTWRAAGLLVLVFCFDVFAQDVTAPAQEKEILYLVPTGNNFAAARVYLRDLCRWITTTPSIRDRYALVYLSSRLERPLDETRSELSEGTDLREPSDSAKMNTGSRPSASPRVSQEDRQLVETLGTAKTLLHGSNSLWDVRSKLSLCHGSQGNGKQEPAARPSKSTVLIAEIVDLGPHGFGLSFVKASSEAGEQAKYDFVPLTETDRPGAVRLLAAGALRPEKMALTQLEIETHIDDVRSCTPSARAHCLMQPGSVKIIVTAADSPFVPSSQVSIPSAGGWRRDATTEGLEAGEVTLEDVSASPGRVEVTARFSGPGLYKLGIPVRTRAPALEADEDVHEIEFEVQAQPLLVRDSDLVAVAGFEGRYWMTTLWDRLWGAPASRDIFKKRIENWRIMPASEINALATELRGSLGNLSSPKSDPDFVASWRKSVGLVVNHDSLRELLLSNKVAYTKQVTSGETTTTEYILRDQVWCEKMVSAALARMPEKLAKSITEYGEAQWRDDCINKVGKSLRSTEARIDQFPHVDRLHLSYNKELPRSFRLLRALKDQDSAETAVSELEFDENSTSMKPFREDLRLSARLDGTGQSEPIPMSLIGYPAKTLLFSAEGGIGWGKEQLTVGEDGNAGVVYIRKAYLRLGMQLQLLSGTVAPGLFFDPLLGVNPELTLSFFPLSLFGRLMSVEEQARVSSDFSPHAHLMTPGGVTLELRAGAATSFRNGFFLGGQLAYSLEGASPLFIGIGYKVYPLSDAQRDVVTVSTGVAL